MAVFEPSRLKKLNHIVQVILPFLRRCLEVGPLAISPQARDHLQCQILFQPKLKKIVKMENTADRFCYSVSYCFLYKYSIDHVLSC